MDGAWADTERARAGVRGGLWCAATVAEWRRTGMWEPGGDGTFLTTGMALDSVGDGDAGGLLLLMLPRAADSPPGNRNASLESAGALGDNISGAAGAGGATGGAGAEMSLALPSWCVPAAVLSRCGEEAAVGVVGTGAGVGAGVGREVGREMERRGA